MSIFSPLPNFSITKISIVPNTSLNSNIGGNCLQLNAHTRLENQEPSPLNFFAGTDIRSCIIFQKRGTTRGFHRIFDRFRGSRQQVSQSKYPSRFAGYRFIEDGPHRVRPFHFHATVISGQPAKRPESSLAANRFFLPVIPPFPRPGIDSTGQSDAAPLSNAS